ncbi:MULTISPECIES: hypothetical protein [Bacillus]|nr:MULTISPECIES: hypothetical protein [Bacillus]AMQ71320.1 hypothetical protein BAMY6639_03790 [Bacillus amyloliquefaciens UMAF6639]AQP97561.1 hypothetical protein BZ167_16980 [Bacillus sp. 275]NER69847.1 hypothetical protein [Bacillus velezensis]QNQ48881.1 hypothetical protein IAR44_12715 [Bacillus velezensis]UBQ45236.1 hypothetical protein LCH16_13055 [Bacillus velezensis]
MSICEIVVFFKNLFTLDAEVVTYLISITSIIATTLALLVIIITIFNEKIVFGAETLWSEINYIIINDNFDNNVKDVIQKINKLQNLYKNSKNYKKTLIFFKFILWIMLIPWGIVLINLVTKYKGIGNVLIISSITLTMMALFYLIPIAFNKFNNFKQFNSNQFTLGNFTSTLNKFKNIEMHEIIEKLNNLILKFSVDKNIINVSINESVKFFNTSLIFRKVIGNESTVLILQPSDNYLSAEYVGTASENSNLEGFIKKLKEDKYGKDELYFKCDKKIVCFNVDVVHSKGHSVMFEISEYKHINTIPAEIKKILKENKNSLYPFDLREKKMIKLISREDDTEKGVN